MPEGLSILNLGELSKPATVLIEKISDAVGGLCKPWQINRVAQAEADAEIIRAKAEIQVTNLQRRALGRFIAEEAQKQDNMEKITAKSIPLLQEGSDPKKMENDWVTNFFDKCRIVSDDQMQVLWAKILAGEANLPGKFSRRTVNLLVSLDKVDAELFTSLCGFCWFVAGDAVPLILEPRDTIYNNQEINFGSLLHLDAAGLMKYDYFSHFHRTRLPKIITVDYYGRLLNIHLPKESDNVFDVGTTIFTKAGEELSSICAPKQVDAFFDYVVETWKKHGLKFSSMDPTSGEAGKYSQ